MTLVVYALSLSIGAVATAIALAVAPIVMTSPRNWKTNYRGSTVFAPAGIVLMKPLFVGAIASLLWTHHERVALVMWAGGTVMGALGYIDDTYGDRHAGGLVGHARALLRGRITTGMMKAVGGAVVGLVAAYLVGWRGAWIVVGGAVVALASNLTNLLDLRPGRALKVWVVCAAAMLAAGVTGGGAIVLATVLAGCVVFAAPELRERVMLGDTGANLLGTTLGIAAVASVGRTALVAILGVLVALTLLSERVSFTRVIESTPPLRWFDQLGRVSSGP